MKRHATEQVTPDVAFARRLREARDRAGLTRADLVGRLRDVVGYDGLSEQALGFIEREERRVTLNDALALAAALDVAPVNLMVPFESPEPIIAEGADRPVFEPTAELKVGEHVTFIPGWARAWIKGTRTRFEATPREILRYYVDEVPPERKWLIEETAAAIRAEDAERVRKLGRITPIDDLPHKLASPASPRFGLPAGLWSLLTNQRDETADEGGADA
jgi:transcriptional regulator with XRE-family HTH domain